MVLFLVPVYPDSPAGLQVGDVIYIEANSGAVKRVGRCDVHATEFDLEAEEYVPLPKVVWTSHDPPLEGILWH